MKEKLRKLEELLTDPFNPEKALSELQQILDELPKLEKEDLEELHKELPKIKRLVEKNFVIALGWLEELPKRLRFERKV
ncbi:hypothetical protein [Thermocrinis jamiesonii]|uniref:hypothetical protein n=1 Tax=Thermocrinis jamiesonii TaxID=1302351 RepID=UPI000496C75F|nr:hypothetical protein [Thermocrinis jamiesonii]